MTKDTPIIFSAPMVRALLEGRKTMTRRIVKLPTKGEYVRPDMGGWAPTTVGGGASFTIRRDGAREPYPERVAIWNQTTGTCIAARYQSGDRLWVRENFAYVGTCDPGFLTYQASYPDDLKAIGCENIPATLKEAGYKWTPCIHMPRTLSRLTLIVTKVKVERLQDISEKDAEAEGCVEDWADGQSVWYVPGGHMSRHRATGKECFEWLWSSINGVEAWEANAFVVAVTFRVIKANIDAPEARVAA